MTVRGIDVASYQTSAPDLAGLGFLMVKATEGTTYTNPRMSAQVAAGRARGLVIGMYHFLLPGQVEDQALHFLRTAPERTGDVLVCDWESESGRAPSCAEKDAFLKAVKAHDRGYRVLLYCNRDFWLNHDTTSFCGDGLWIADPSSPAGHPRIQHPWTIHQYGITGGTDQNIANFADLAAMKRWAGVPAATPPPLTLDQRVTALEKSVPALERRVTALEDK